MAILDCSSSLNENEHGKASDRWALWCIAVANFASDRDQNAAGPNNKVMAKRGLLSGDRIGRRAKSIGANPLSHRTTSKVLSIQFVEAYPCGGRIRPDMVNRATRLGRPIHHAMAAPQRIRNKDRLHARQLDERKCGRAGTSGKPSGPAVSGGYSVESHPSSGPSAAGRRSAGRR